MERLIFNLSYTGNLKIDRKRRFFMYYDFILLFYLVKKDTPYFQGKLFTSNNKWFKKQLRKMSQMHGEFVDAPSKHGFRLPCVTVEQAMKFNEFLIANPEAVDDYVSI